MKKLISVLLALAMVLSLTAMTSQSVISSLLYSAFAATLWVGRPRVL